MQYLKVPTYEPRLRLQWLIDPDIDAATAAGRFSALILPPRVQNL